VSFPKKPPTVLFLPQATRHEQFVELVRAIGETCTTLVIDASASRRHYQNLSDRFIPFPDWPRCIPTGSELEFATRQYSILEQETGFSANRIILAGERNIGAAYGQGQYAWPKSNLRRNVCLDNELPFKIICGMLLWATDLLDHNPTKTILAGSSSSPINLVISLIAQQRGIPFISLRSSKIHSGRFFCTEDRLMFNDRTEFAYSVLSRNNETHLPQGEKFLKEFRDKPKTVQYIKNNWKIAEEIGFFEQHRRFFVIGLMSLTSFVRRSKSLPPKPFFSTVSEHYKRKFRQKRQEGFYTRLSTDHLMNLKYLFLPLHKEPELALNLQGYSWHNQINTVARVSAVLPAGFRLLVKEHRFNYGRRPSAQVKKLLALPGVLFIDPFENSFPYIRNADLVITENGSSGWEALIFKRPVVSLDKAFYDVLGLTTRLNDFSDLNEAVVSSLFFQHEDSEYDTKLKRLIEAEFLTTIAEESSEWVDLAVSEIQKRSGELSLGFKQK